MCSYLDVWTCKNDTTDSSLAVGIHQVTTQFYLLGKGIAATMSGAIVYADKMFLHEYTSAFVLVSCLVLQCIVGMDIAHVSSLRKGLGPHTV